MPDYFILGSKRSPDGKHWQDRLPAMLEQKLLEVDWAEELPSLSHLYAKPEGEIVAALHDLGEERAACHAHKLFLNLRPGDLVAIKKFAAPHGRIPVLSINAFARVVQRNGVVYRRGKPPLTHCINAEFLEHGIERKFQIGGYGTTIHRLTNVQHIRQIFEPLFGRKFQLNVVAPAQRSRWERRASAVANLENLVRQNNAGTIEVQQIHHKIRNRLYEHLAGVHGAENVWMERDFVDVQVRANGGLVLYEIKSFPNPSLCIREALGQVMMYAWSERFRYDGEIKLVVVGPNAPTKTDREFLEFVKQSLRIDIDYLTFASA